MRSVAALPSLVLTLLAVPFLSACSALGIPPLPGQALLGAASSSSAPGTTPGTGAATPLALTPTFFSTSDGYAMTLPAGWGAVRVAPNAAAGLLDVLNANDASLAGFARGILAATGARLSMVGADLLDASLVVPPGVLCLVLPTHGATNDDVEATVQQDIATSPAVDGAVSHTVITVPAGDAHRFELQVRGSGAPVRLRVYLFLVGADAVVLVFGASASGFDAASPSFDAIVKSLRFGV
jgi:hypothetical protein